MKKIDLHVHSKYSSESQNPVIKALHSSESYTEPEHIYKMALQRGMDMVTITDHDTITGCLQLQQNHPERVILGVEATAFFPENRVPVHILLYGFTEEQFATIDKLRKDIYQLRDFIKKHRIACSVAHATYRLTDKFSIEHIEKLILLFDVFEGRNGCRNARCNESFVEVLKSLTPEKIDELYRIHGIEPFSDTPWKKSLTAGSDDHAGIFIGNTWTGIDADTPEEAVEALRQGKSEMEGNSRDYRLFAFQIYKITMDNILARKGENKSVINEINNLLFLNSKPGLISRYKINRLRRSRSLHGRSLDRLVKIHGSEKTGFDKKLELMYEEIINLSDSITGSFFKHARESIEKGDIGSIVSSLSSLLGGLSVYIPVSFALKYLNKDIGFQEKISQRFFATRKKHRKRILWFTDTINDLNGVSVTLRNIGWKAYQRGEDLSIVSSLLDDEPRNELPPNVINLEPLFYSGLPYYDKLTFKVPSLLRMFETLSTREVDEVYISSPGIIGLYGLIYAKLMGLKCKAVYHTDFTMQAANIIDEESPLIRIIEKYTKWFHEQADRIMVPTREYIDLLEERGFDSKKLKLFYRGIDAAYFEPKKEGREFLEAKLGIHDGINLVYAGRISDDKNIDFLVKSYEKLIKEKSGINLVFVGDGPTSYMKDLKSRTANLANVYFTGRIPNKMLPLVYSGSDILVFPSETDTFGMVVLEAQSCGLPALVSNVGGPKGIIKDNDTGFVLDTGNTETWAYKIKEIVDWIEKRDDRYFSMRQKARENVLVNYEYSRVLDNYFTDESYE